MLRLASRSSKGRSPDATFARANIRAETQPERLQTRPRFVTRPALARWRPSPRRVSVAILSNAATQIQSPEAGRPSRRNSSGSPANAPRNSRSPKATARRQLALPRAGREHGGPWRLTGDNSLEGKHKIEPQGPASSPKKGDPEGDKFFIDAKGRFSSGSKANH